MDDAPRILFTRLIDDAGVFPPARKPMQQAVADHRVARLGAYEWILGRFLCPVSRLGELAAAGLDEGWELGAIADGPDWRADLAAAAAYDGPGQITAVELKRPQDAPPATVREAAPSQLDVFFEVAEPDGHLHRPGRGIPQGGTI